MKLAFLASHNGSSAKAITQACLAGVLEAEPSLLISNNPGAAALSWAKDMHLISAVINGANSNDPDAAIAGLLRDHAVDLVVCSGYMKLIGPQTIAAAKGAILNVHPALLPRYGGRGMYGRHVHQAVYDNRDPETGITIHQVNGQYDAGPVVAQKKLPVSPGSSVDDIESAVKAAEPGFYIETLDKILSGGLTLSLHIEQ